MAADYEGTLSTQPGQRPWRSYVAVVPDDFGPWDTEDLFEDDGDDGDPDQPPAPTELGAEPSPGERLLFALGQLYRLFRHGRLNVRPEHFDIWELAAVIGVQGDIEFVSEDFRGSHWHFPAEVMHVNMSVPFPWRLLSTWEWASEQESESDWLDGWQGYQ